jgi:hypothetical protein
MGCSSCNEIVRIFCSGTSWVCSTLRLTRGYTWSVVKHKCARARAHTHTQGDRERERFPPELVSSMHILCLKPGGRKGSSTQDGDRWQVQYHRQSHHLQRYYGSECYLPSLWPQQILDQSELSVWHAAEVDSFFLGYGFQLQWHGKLKESSLCRRCNLRLLSPWKFASKSSALLFAAVTF